LNATSRSSPLPRRSPSFTPSPWPSWWRACHCECAEPLASRQVSHYQYRRARTTTQVSLHSIGESCLKARVTGQQLPDLRLPTPFSRASLALFCHTFSVVLISLCAGRQYRREPGIPLHVDGIGGLHKQLPADRVGCASTVVSARRLTPLCLLSPRCALAPCELTCMRAAVAISMAPR
jgi:hypothetical protein